MSTGAPLFAGCEVKLARILIRSDPLKRSPLEPLPRVTTLMFVHWVPVEIWWYYSDDAPSSIVWLFGSTFQRGNLVQHASYSWYCSVYDSASWRTPAGTFFLDVEQTDIILEFNRPGFGALVQAARSAKLHAAPCIDVTQGRPGSKVRTESHKISSSNSIWTLPWELFIRPLPGTKQGSPPNSISYINPTRPTPLFKISGSPLGTDSINLSNFSLPTSLLSTSCVTNVNDPCRATSSC